MDSQLVAWERTQRSSTRPHGEEESGPTDTPPPLHAVVLARSPGTEWIIFYDQLNLEFAMPFVDQHHALLRAAFLLDGSHKHIASLSIRRDSTGNEYPLLHSRHIYICILMSSCSHLSISRTYNIHPYVYILPGLLVLFLALHLFFWRDTILRWWSHSPPSLPWLRVSMRLYS